MKTAGISKYDIHWQIVRVGLKGKFNTDISRKIKIAIEYFCENPNASRRERVLNWLKGLEKGFKDSYKKNGLRECIQSFSSRSYNEELEPTADSPEDFAKYTKSQLYYLYLDLFKTNANWLRNGYFHKECNAFLDKLIVAIGEENIVKDYSKSKLEELRLKANSIPNTHKFLF